MKPHELIDTLGPSIELGREDGVYEIETMVFSNGAPVRVSIRLDQHGVTFFHQASPDIHEDDARLAATRLNVTFKDGVFEAGAIPASAKYALAFVANAVAEADRLSDARLERLAHEGARDIQKARLAHEGMQDILEEPRKPFGEGDASKGVLSELLKAEEPQNSLAG